MSVIKTFEDLECWKKCTTFRQKIATLIKTFPDFEKFELTSQMRRASRSVTHNIAEGYGRFHYKENAQFCRIARGSLYELIDQLIITKEEEYIKEKEYHELRVLAEESIRILNGYIKYLSSKPNN